MAKAKETTEKIDAELKDLQATLANIEDARPFEDLTVSDTRAASLIIVFNALYLDQVEEVGKAHPRIVETVENMLKKGKWTVPGESFFAFVIFGRSSVPIVQDTRRSSATFPLCKRRRAPHRFNRSRRRLTFLRRECMHDNVGLGAFRANSNHCSVLP